MTITKEVRELTYGDNPLQGFALTWYVIVEKRAIHQLLAEYRAGRWEVMYRVPIDLREPQLTWKLRNYLHGWSRLKTVYSGVTCYQTLESARDALIEELRMELLIQELYIERDERRKKARHA